MVKLARSQLTGFRNWAHFVPEVRVQMLKNNTISNPWMPKILKIHTTLKNILLFQLQSDAVSQQEQVQRLSGTFTALPANVVSESTSETATSNENIVTAQHKPIKLPPDPPLRSDSRLSQVYLKVNITRDALSNWKWISIFGSTR